MQNQDSTKQNQPLSSALSPEQGNNESKDANQKNGTKKDRGLADFVPRKRNNESDEEGFYFPRR